MVIKSDLIQMLERALEFEEKSVPLLHEKCLRCFLEIKQSEIIEEDKRRMRRILNELVSDAREHRLALEELIEKVDGGKENEF